MSTVLRENRTVLHVDGQQLFQVSVVCSDSGTLPDTGIFLYQIADPNAPLQDVFVRIVDIADFAASDAYLPNRTSAILRGDTYWRSAVLSKTYDSIDVADASVRAIFDRVNKLVNDYATYNNSFAAVDVSVYFPTTDPSQVEMLKTAYDDARTAYDEAVAAETAAQDDLTAAQSAVVAAQSVLDAWLSAQTKFSLEGGNDLQSMADAVSAFQAFVTAGSYNATGFIGAVNAFILTYIEKFGVMLRKLTLTNYTDCVPLDIGKDVIYGAAVRGKLRAFTNTPPTMWVVPNTEADDFPPSSVVTIAGGVGAGTVVTSTLVGAGPMDPELVTLQQWRDNFNVAKELAISAIAQAAAGKVHHDNTKAYIDSKVVAYTTELSVAQSNVTSKQVAYNQARGNTQTAYTALRNAYDAVKAVCPNWTPTNPLPPTP